MSTPPYRGADRRRRVAQARPLPLLAVGRSASLLVVFTLAIASTVFLRDGGLDAATATERLLGALLGVAAGLASLVNWRAEGRAFDAWIGSMLVTTGVLLVVALGSPVGTSGVAGAQPMQLLVVAVTAGTLADRAIAADEVDAGVTPVRSLLVAAVTGLAVIASLDALGPRGLLPNAVTGPGATRACLVAAGSCWVVSSNSAVVKRRRGGTVPSWAPVTFSLLAVGPLVGAVDPRPTGWTTTAVALAATSAFSLAFVATMWKLDHVLRHQDRQALRLHLDLDRLSSELDDHQRDLEERLHDLRNAVTGLRGADSTLRTHAARLDPASRRALAEAMSAELARLQALIEPGRSPAPVVFEVAKALEPVVAAERSLGVTIDVMAGSVRAYGDPAGFAQVLQNLLVNARRYAPGSPVTVVASSRSGRVEILVADEGPGIPEHERTRVFLRGARGETSAGTMGDGLGLHVSARLLAEAGGRIRVVDGPARGACFLVELPAVHGAASGPGPVRDVEGVSA